MPEFISSKSLSKRIISIVFGSILLIVGYLSFNSYFTFLNEAEKSELEMLSAIASTAALHINADDHTFLMQKYQKKDGITYSEQDSIYSYIHHYLNDVYKANDLRSPIYTLVKGGDHDFCFGVTSSENPYFRHVYESFPPQLKESYMKGAMIPRFNDDHGTWLSSFSPLKNKKGEVVAVVMVDMQFDSFIQDARQRLWKDLFISLLIVITIGAVLYKYLKQITDSEEKAKKELASSYQIIEKKNKNIEDSINYAKRIQDALVPGQQIIKTALPDSFVFFRGKDVVSGDFPWFISEDNQDEVLIATVDCTGHGVPGALLSIIGYFLLNDIIHTKRASAPGDILKLLHEGVVDSLNQRHDNVNSNDGMDVALVKINKKTKTIQFAGAHRPLLFMRNGEIEVLKGSKLSVGGLHYEKKNIKMDFVTHEVQYDEGDVICFFSDGLPDQIGGPKGKKFMTKNVKTLLTESQGKPMEDIGLQLENEFDAWKGDKKQLDDVLVIGVRL